MSKNKKVLSVSFNKTKEDDLKCLEKVSPKDFNFSGYVKKLILEDIKREQSKVVHRSENGGIRIVING